MSPRGALLVFAGAGLLWGAGAWAQTPAPKPGAAKPAPPAASAPAAKNAPTVYYDSYQASMRERLRKQSCLKDEDMVGRYCVKGCQKNFVEVDAKKLPRICRSVKPLPPGALPQPIRKQRAQAPRGTRSEPTKVP